MDYRYYYESLEAAPPRGRSRGTRVRTALVAGLLAEAVVASTQAFASVPGLGSVTVLSASHAPVALLACALAAGLAVVLERPARRLFARGRTPGRRLP